MPVQPAGKYLLSMNKEQSPAQYRDSQATLLKFEESAWKCVAYTCLAVVAGRALWNETFWHDTRSFWTDCTRVPCEYESTPQMLTAYAADMAYYTYAIPYCIMFETKRKDFWATFAHHIVTVLLIGACLS
jgi:TLC domain